MILSPQHTPSKEYRNHPKQRGAAHVWYDQCADVLNDNGITLLIVVELLKKYGVTWSGAAFKELVWKPILKSQQGKTSTEDQLTTDVETTRREIILLLGQHLGVELPPWPDRFNQGSN